MSNIIQSIVNGKVIATGKGGNMLGTPWATVICDATTKELVDIKWYESEELASLGHRQAIVRFGGKV